MRKLWQKFKTWREVRWFQKAVNHGIKKANQDRTRGKW